MANKTGNALLAASAGLILNGCAVSDNPNEGGLVGGVYGLASGRYEERVDERQENLDSLKALQQQEESSQQTLQKDKADSQARLKALTERSRQLETDINELTKRAADLTAKNQQAESRRVALAKQSTELQKAVKALQASLSNAPSDAELKKFEADEQRIKQDVAQLKEDLFDEGLFD